MAAEYDEYEEEEAPAPKKPRRPRKPIDWPLLIMLVGSLVFLLVFGAITLLAPRRPFLALRGAQSAPRPTAVVTTGTPPADAAKPATTPAAATPPAGATPPPKA